MPISCLWTPLDHEQYTHWGSGGKGETRGKEADAHLCVSLSFASSRATIKKRDFLASEIPKIFELVRKLMPKQKFHTSTHQNGLFPTSKPTFDLVNDVMRIWTVLNRLGTAVRNNVRTKWGLWIILKLYSLRAAEACNFTFTQCKPFYWITANSNQVYTCDSPGRMYSYEGSVMTMLDEQATLTCK